MLLNDVVNYNHSIEKTNVNNVNDFKELIKKIDKRKNSIQRGIIEIQERAKYRQDIRDNIIKDIDHLDYIENLKDYQIYYLSTVIEQKKLFLFGESLL